MTLISPDIVFWEGFCVPRDGDDEEESPSPVEKGEGARLAGKGSHCRCDTYPPSIRTGPPSLSGKDKRIYHFVFPFRKDNYGTMVANLISNGGLSL